MHSPGVKQLPRSINRSSDMSNGNRSCVLGMASTEMLNNFVVASPENQVRWLARFPVVTFIQEIPINWQAIKPVPGRWLRLFCAVIFAWRSDMSMAGIQL